MKKAFPGYFADDSEILRDLWGKCIFVLDASVLLSFYRYSEETRTELFEIFKGLNERLWIPHQVASEYLVNRVLVISNQVKIYEQAIKSTTELKRSFLNPKQHPFLKEETLRESTAIFDKVVEDLEAYKNEFLCKVDEDDVKSQLSNLLDGRVGEPLSNSDVAEVLVVGPARYAQRIPPGYQDVGKMSANSEVTTDKLRPLADYIVWRQTLAKAKADGLPVVFVTGDSKEDWWTIYSGRILGPHPKLIEEFVREVGQGFYMYLPEQFMEKANAYLDRATSQSAVDEIVDAREEGISEDAALISQRLKADALIAKVADSEGVQALRTELEVVFGKMDVVLPHMDQLDNYLKAITANRKASFNSYNDSLRFVDPEGVAVSTAQLHVLSNLDKEIEDVGANLEKFRRTYQGYKERVSELQKAIARYDL
ncbi:hypothetical protein DMX11_22000 [Pseudomonas sp. LB-090624]|uniref:PIN-like domain-containing protein n=1 Tax=Pseudomonas sp. LB-090624 TaxID=2213079 RepID=UPI000D8B7CA6|nr:PIN-like domain-containing protein [Pseudomonas sp. LB-090624]PYB70347.1 hypothetical protein DMX11_22000 [Pseudomonas sp. LB-090624]